MNAREMMEEMLQELAGIVRQDEELQIRIIRGVEPRTTAQRQRALRVLGRGIEYLKGESGRTGGF